MDTRLGRGLGTRACSEVHARHLGLLRELGLIKAERRGAEVELELGSPVTGDLMSAVCAWVNPETGERFSTTYSELVGKEA